LEPKIAAKAYANATLRNNYFAWLYEFKVKNLSTTLKMEYNQVVLQDGEEGQDTLQEQNQANTILQLFCGDMDMIEVSIPTSVASNTTPFDDEEMDDLNEEPSSTRAQFELLFDAGQTTDAFKAARNFDHAIQKEIKEQIDLDQVGNGDGTSRCATFLKMRTKLDEDASQPLKMTN
jgi:hypothetical protein